MDEKRIVSLAEVLSLPTPTESQSEAFVVHLADAHSWYKHLPLLGGAEFIVFLDPRAGQDNHLAHPWLPQSQPTGGAWKPNTVEVYRQAFGHLNYLWRASPFDPYDTDGRNPFEDPLPAPEYFLAEIGRFTLYPYVACEFYWCVHKEALFAMECGAYHPRAQLVLEAFAANSEHEKIWRELAAEERELARQYDDSLHLNMPIPEVVMRYRSAEHRYYELMAELQASEMNTIRNHVLGLRNWHLSNRIGVS
jgi:hypothetical protein